MRGLRRFFPGLVLTLVLVGCGPDAPLGPPEVRLGVDECSYCRMIVSELRYAAVGRSASGEEIRFDDLGCAERFFAEPGADAGQWTVWLHQHEGEGWIPAEGAWLVDDPAASTPMGHGVLAFGDEAAARARVATSPGSQLRRWGR